MIEKFGDNSDAQLSLLRMLRDNDPEIADAALEFFRLPETKLLLGPDSPTTKTFLSTLLLFVSNEQRTLVVLESIERSTQSGELWAEIANQYRAKQKTLMGTDTGEAQRNALVIKGYLDKIRTILRHAGCSRLKQRVGI